MRNRYALLLMIFALLCMTPGCERRPLEEEYFNFADVIVEIDWSRTSLNPVESTLIFYPENGSKPRYHYLLDNRTSVKLPPGNYSVLVINENFENFDAIAFRNTEHYNTIEAYIKPSSGNNNYLRAAGEVTGETPDVLASDSRDKFVVSQQMVEETRASRALSRSRGDDGAKADIVLIPVEVVAETKLKVHIKNMHLIRNGSHSAAIRGFAESVLLHNRKNTSTEVTHLLSLPYAEYYPGSDEDGFMSDHFTVFGFSNSASQISNPVHFVFQAVLRDKDMTLFSYEVEITDLVEINVEIGMKINIEIGIDPGQDNPPVPVPPVEPDDNEAFKPSVDDWDEVEVVKPMY